MRFPSALLLLLLLVGADAGHGVRGLPHPLRGWAFPYRFNGSFELYPAITVNFNPTLDTKCQAASDQAARGIAVLDWAYCWNRPLYPAEKRDPHCVGRNCTVANRTAMVEVFAAYVFARDLLLVISRSSTYSPHSSSTCFPPTSLLVCRRAGTGW